MDFLKKLFQTEKPAPVPDEAAHMQAMELANQRYMDLSNLLKTALEHYQNNACPCAYPRFRQICSVTCIGLDAAFKCHETEMLIQLAKESYATEKSPLGPDVEQWTCRKCQSTFTFVWQDFSISLDASLLQVNTLKVEDVGKPTRKPLPLFLGLYGHEYPPEGHFLKVDFDVFKAYILESD